MYKLFPFISPGISLVQGLCFLVSRWTANKGVDFCCNLSHKWWILTTTPKGTYTSTGRKFALVEGVNHDLVCGGSNYHVHFAWQVWHGQYSPGFKFNKLKSFSRVEIDRTHVDLKDSRGKGFALRRLNKHNFCLASVGQTRGYDQKVWFLCWLTFWFGVPLPIFYSRL